MLSVPELTFTVGRIFCAKLESWLRHSTNFGRTNRLITAVFEVSEIIIIVVRFAHRKLRFTMADLDEYQMFAPPSTAGSSNTLTLSSGSSGVASHGFATPLVAKTLFSSSEKISEEDREMNDDEQVSKTKKITVMI